MRICSSALQGSCCSVLTCMYIVGALYDRIITKVDAFPQSFICLQHPLAGS